MPSWLMRVGSPLLAILICCTPEMLSATSGQQSEPTQTQSPSVTAPQTQSVPSQTEYNSGSDSASPSEPLPDAPSTTAQSAPAQPRSDSAQDQPTAEPAGTAAAQIGKLKGGPASKPAGAAIAPAKQRRVRSLLIKIGALAAAGAAAGTVYALSQGSPSRPPGAH